MNYLYGEMNLSRQAFRKKTRVKLDNMALKYLVASEDNLRPHTSKHLNKPDGTCKVCEGKRAFDISTHRVEPFVGHHTSYFPAVIAFVHYNCHKKIHDKENPISELINYNENDSKKYYDLRNQHFESNGHTIA